MDDLSKDIKLISNDNAKNKKEININKGHRERIRKKYLNNGLSSFYDYEILELLLTYCIPVKDVKNLAKELLKKFKTLDKITKINKNDVKNIKGVSENTVIFLNLIGDVAGYLYSEKLEEDTDLRIKDKDILLKYLRQKIAFQNVESFYVIYLNVLNKVIKFEEQTKGTLDRSSVYPREIYKRVIELDAKAIIIAHNHPSGSAKPSQSDIHITKEIEKGLKNFDAILLEHIIITENTYFSFLEEGILER